MSVKVMARVWAHSQQSGGGLLVMLALADFANDGGECWPSIPVLAHKARLSDREIRYLLPKLEQAGEIRITRSNGGRNRRNRYVVTVTENPEDISVKTFQGNNFSESCDTKTLKPTSGALNRHRTVKRVARNSTRAPNSQSDSRIRSLFDFWGRLYQERFGAPYAFNGKDGAILKGLLPKFSEGDIEAVMGRFLNSKDEWIRTKGGYTIGVFYSQFNKLVSTAGKHAEKPRGLQEIPPA